MNQNEEIPKGMARVHLNDGKFAYVPLNALDAFLKANEHLTNNSHPALRRRIANYAKKHGQEE